MKVLGMTDWVRMSRAERDVVTDWLKQHNVFERGAVAVEEGDGETIVWTIFDDKYGTRVGPNGDLVRERITVETTDFPWPTHLTKASA